MKAFPSHSDRLLWGPESQQGLTPNPRAWFILRLLEKFWKELSAAMQLDGRSQAKVIPASQRRILSRIVPQRGVDGRGED
ncbi:hypothetical protein VM1G_11462 [Cytospora mali]|uniref:Uncharacterized protein n=1 Tax=Cytospora mali TaxID=578113 RepID=A0A194VVA6_CYTMA|nr:hypothetical protein VM1G_11462 [Valsa mali]